MTGRGMLAILSLEDMDRLYVRVNVLGWMPHRNALIPADLFPENLIENIEMSPGPEERDDVKLYVFCHMDMNATDARALGVSLAGPWELHRSHIVSETWTVDPDTHEVTDLGIRPWHEPLRWDEAGNMILFSSEVEA